MIRNVEGLVDRVCSEIRKHADFAVIGLSGGADSTLVATLCVRALGKENVYGMAMPYNELDKNTFNARASELAFKLGLVHQVLPITKVADAIIETLKCGQDIEISKVNAGNARSRARMCMLYATTHALNDSFEGEKRVRVVGTGNLSEDFIGYDTKGGDALCDFFPIGSLFKSEVYQLLDHFIEEGVLAETLVDRVPSAGLWEGQTDESEIGHSYDEMEEGVRSIMECQRIGITPEERLTQLVKREDKGIESFVLRRHLANKHKHEAPPVVDLREFCI